MGTLGLDVITTHYETRRETIQTDDSALFRG